MLVGQGLKFTMQVMVEGGCHQYVPSPCVANPVVSRGACTYPFYIPLGQMNPKGLRMFIPLSPKGIYTPYKVDWKPRKLRSMNKGYVLPPLDCWKECQVYAEATGQSPSVSKFDLHTNGQPHALSTCQALVAEFDCLSDQTCNMRKQAYTSIYIYILCTHYAIYEA